MKKCFVGFDTSNYTTSVAACDVDGNVIANLKAPLEVKAGDRGLRQSDALFAHIKNIPVLANRLADEIGCEYEAVAVGVSSAPRDIEGSYMPCFLAGTAAAYSYAAARSLPVRRFSHQSGHIMAAAYSSGQTERLMRGEFIALHVSGGTTDVLKVTPSADGFSLSAVGGSLDINAGQLIDRIGVAMGLSFPCGPALERLAASFEGELPKIRICVNGGQCNFSGAENKALDLYRSTGDMSACAAYVFEFICATLIEMCRNVSDLHGSMPILFSGGVMSNTYMRQRISDRFDACFADAQFSADNAAGIALLCRMSEI